jgi:hypothetical protein
LLLANLLCAREWNTIHIVPGATIQFPEKPKEAAISTTMNYIITERQQEYLVQVEKKDPAFIKKIKKNMDEYYSSFAKILVRNENINLESTIACNQDGFKGMEIYYTEARENKKSNHCFLRLFIIKDYLVQICYTTTEVIEENKARFFTSLKKE